MQTIQAILQYPNGTPIEAVQAKLAQVYEYKSIPEGKYGPTTVQNVMLEDGAGNRIRVSVWGHPDMKAQEGGEFVFSGGKAGKGLTVKTGTYQDKPTIELSMGKAGTMQFIEVHHAQNGTKAVSGPAKAPNPAGPTQGAPTNQIAPQTIRGDKVGMALKVAAEVAVASGVFKDLDYKGTLDALKILTVDIIRLSNGLESGAIRIEPATEAEKQANLVDKSGKPAATDENPDF